MRGVPDGEQFDVFLWGRPLESVSGRLRTDPVFISFQHLVVEDHEQFFEVFCRSRNGQLELRLLRLAKSWFMLVSCWLLREVMC